MLVMSENKRFFKNHSVENLVEFHRIKNEKFFGNAVLWMNILYLSCTILKFSSLGVPYDAFSVDI